MTDKKQGKPAAKAEDKPKQKRTMLTPEQRVAKLEAELEAAKVKAQGKDRKRHDELTKKIESLDERMDKLNDQRSEAITEINAIEQRVPELRSDVVIAEA